MTCSPLAPVAHPCPLHHLAPVPITPVSVPCPSQHPPSVSIALASVPCPLALVPLALTRMPAPQAAAVCLEPAVTPASGFTAWLRPLPVQDAARMCMAAYDKVEGGLEPGSHRFGVELKAELAWAHASVRHGG
jgi:hypothetical protein